MFKIAIIIVHWSVFGQPVKELNELRTFEPRYSSIETCEADVPALEDELFEEFKDSVGGVAYEIYCVKASDGAAL